MVASQKEEMIAKEAQNDSQNDEVEVGGSNEKFSFEDPMRQRGYMRHSKKLTLPSDYPRDNAPNTFSIEGIP